MYAGWPFFQTLIDNAQLTMRKADMGIASLYAELVDDAKIRRRMLGILGAEFERTEKAILAITGQKRSSAASRCSFARSSCAIPTSIRSTTSRWR